MDPSKKYQDDSDPKKIDFQAFNFPPCLRLFHLSLSELQSP